ncbi:hypothetical protein TgHK011_007520 [Trichoderma gracile]|nr:hypothetical protein TgHK011_007520 [Trichoderma gracile]
MCRAATVSLPVSVRLQPLADTQRYPSRAHERLRLAGTHRYSLAATCALLRSPSRRYRTHGGARLGRAKAGHRQGIDRAPDGVEAQHEEVPGARRPGTFSTASWPQRRKVPLVVAARTQTPCAQRLPASKSPASGGFSPQQRCEPGPKLTDIWSGPLMYPIAQRPGLQRAGSTLTGPLPVPSTTGQKAGQGSAARPRSSQPNAAEFSLAGPGPSTQRYPAGVG